MSNPSRRPPRPAVEPESVDDAVTAPPADGPKPESTTVTVKASLPLAGLFTRDQVRTVERTPFVEALIANGKLTVQD